MNRLKASALVLLLSTSFSGCTRPVVQPTATTDTPTTVADLTAPAIPADIAAQLSLPSTLNMSGFGSDTAPADSGGGFPVIPVVIGAAFAGGLYWWFKGRKSNVDVAPEDLKLMDEAQEAATAGNPAKADAVIGKMGTFKKALIKASDQISQDAATLSGKALKGPDLVTFVNNKKADYVLAFQATITARGMKNPGEIYNFVREIHEGNYGKLVSKLAQESDLTKKRVLIQAYYKHSAIDLLTIRAALEASAKDLKINQSTYDALQTKLDDVLKYHKANGQLQFDNINKLDNPERKIYSTKGNAKLYTAWMDDPKSGAWSKTVATTP